MIETRSREKDRVNGIVAAVLSASISPLHGALAKEKRKASDPRIAGTRDLATQKIRVVVAQ